MLLIVGSPRSGTSWLASIFNSHPDVLYVHEPDSQLLSHGFPQFPVLDQAPDETEEARAYLDRLFDCRSVRALTKLQMFEKSFLTPAHAAAYRAYLYGMASLERVPFTSRWVENLPVPGLDRVTRDASVYRVVKSVVSNGRAPLYLEAKPDLKVVHIVRHPCGTIDSQLRGRSLGKMRGASRFPIKTLSQTEIAREKGWTEEFLRDADATTKMTVYWLIANEFVMASCTDNDRYRMLVYEDLCAEPVSHARELMEFAGLTFAPQTESFLDQSLNAGSAEEPDYFSLVRNPMQAASRWKTSLDAQVVDSVAKLIEGTRVGSVFEFPR